MVASPDDTEWGRFVYSASCRRQIWHNIWRKCFYFFGGEGGGDKNWSHFSILNIVSQRPKKNHHWLNPSLSKIESGIPFWRGGKVKPYSCVVWRRGGLNLGVPEFSFERNEIVNELIKKKGNGWAERKGIMLRLFNVLCQSGKWFTPRLYTPPPHPSSIDCINICVCVFIYRHTHKPVHMCPVLWSSSDSDWNSIGGICRHNITRFTWNPHPASCVLHPASCILHPAPDSAGATTESLLSVSPLNNKWSEPRSELGNWTRKPRCSFSGLDTRTAWRVVLMLIF